MRTINELHKEIEDLKVRFRHKSRECEYWRDHWRAQQNRADQLAEYIDIDKADKEIQLDRV